jgi:hypothetical protein
MSTELLNLVGGEAAAVGNPSGASATDAVASKHAVILVRLLDIASAPRCNPPQVACCGC